MELPMVRHSVIGPAAAAKMFMGILHGGRTFGGPLQANLRLINRCNLRCIHCYFFSPLSRNVNFQPARRARQDGHADPERDRIDAYRRQESSSSKLNALIDDLLQAGTRRFQLGGNGEPLLHRNFMEFAFRIKHAGRYCLANTNGTLLSREMADQMIRTGFDELRITTLAASAKTYTATHPGSDGSVFNGLVETLRYLSDAKERLHKREPRLTLIMVVFNRNCNEIETFARFAANLNADRVWYRPLDDLNDPGLRLLLPDRDQAAGVADQLRSAAAVLETKGIPHNVEAFQSVFRKRIDTRAYFETIPCYYGWLSVLVDPDGEVYPCCRCYRSLGNAYAESIRTIWNGPAFRAFRRNSRRMDRRMAAGCECQRCVHHEANRRIGRVLHPIKSRRSLAPAASE